MKTQKIDFALLYSLPVHDGDGGDGGDGGGGNDGGGGDPLANLDPEIKKLVDARIKDEQNKGKSALDNALEEIELLKTKATLRMRRVSLLTSS
jgi:hypothetical protein